MTEKISIDDVIDFLASEIDLRLEHESTRNKFIKNAIDCLYDCKAKLKSSGGIISDKISINEVIGFLEGELYTIPESLTEEEEEKWLFEIGANDAIEDAIEWLEDYETKNDIEWLEDCETKWESLEDSEVNMLENKDANNFKEITEEMLALYLLKNKNYGNSFSQQFSEYGLTSSCIRLEDKLRRIKTINKQLENREKTNTDDESIRDSLVDLANYAILTVIELDREGK